MKTKNLQVLSKNQMLEISGGFIPIGPVIVGILSTAPYYYDKRDKVVEGIKDALKEIF